MFAGARDLSLMRFVIFILLGVLAVLMLVLLAAFIFIDNAHVPHNVIFTQPKGAPPISKFRVTVVNGLVSEIFATLEFGSRLENVVNLEVFDGFDPRMTKENAITRLARPSDEWIDPYYKVLAPFYLRNSGRVSLCHVGDSLGYSWNVVAYPNKDSVWVQ